MYCDIQGVYIQYISANLSVRVINQGCQYVYVHPHQGCQ